MLDLLHQEKEGWAEIKKVQPFLHTFFSATLVGGGFDRRSSCASSSSRSSAFAIFISPEGGEKGCAENAIGGGFHDHHTIPEIKLYHCSIFDCCLLQYNGDP